MRAWTAGLVSLLVLAGGCEDPVDPTVEIVAGAYEATAFTVRIGGANTDVLAAGGSIDLVLAMDGTTSGRLFIPGAAAGGVDIDQNLTGSWTLARRTVTLQLDGDVFLRDLPLEADGERLEGEGDFGGGSVRVVLVR